MGLGLKVVVVGGGVIGQCSALELAKRGHEVTICDANLEAGCSYGNGGIIVPSHFIPIASPEMVKAGIRMMTNPKSPFGFGGFPSPSTIGWAARFLSQATQEHVHQTASLIRDLNLASRELYKSLAEEMGNSFGLGQRGLLMICRTERGLDGERHVAAQGRDLGLAVQELSWDGLRELEPKSDLMAVGGVHFKDDAHLTPAQFMAALTNRLSELKVRFVKENVNHGKIAGERLVSISTDSQTIEADEFVFATGAWTQKWAKKFDLNLPMVSGRGYGFTLPREELDLSHPAILVEARIAVTPMLDGTRFVGCLELGQPTTRPLAPRLKGMMDAIPAYYPQVKRSRLSELEVWTGHRPCTPDGLPYIGRSKRLNGVVWAAGHAMMGMSLGPITGSLVSQIIDKQAPEIPMSRLSPDRYVY
jgi:D-amino-acid dehydrogenase